MQQNINYYFQKINVNENFVLKKIHNIFLDTHIFINLSFKNENNQEINIPDKLDKLCTSITEIIKHQVSDNPDEDLYEVFEEGLKSVNALLDSEDKTKYDIVIALLHNNELHITKTGDAIAYLIRNNNVIDITEGLSNIKDKAFFTNIASGELLNDDMVLFSTKKVLRYVPKGEILNLQNFDEPDIALSNLINRLQFEDIQDLLLGLFTFEQEEIEELEEKQESENIKKPILNKKTNDFVNKIKKYFNFLVQGFQDERTKQKYIVIGIVIIIFVLILLITRPNQNLTQQNITEYGAKLERIEIQIENLNITATRDPEVARKEIVQIEAEIQALEDANVFLGEVVNFRNDISKLKQKIDNIIIVEEPQLYVNIAEKDPLVDGKILTMLKGSLYAISATKVYGPIIDGSPETYVYKQLDNIDDVIIDADRFSDRDDLIILTMKNRVIEYRNGEFVSMNTQDDRWPNAIKINTYGDARNIYLLVPDQNDVYTYQRRATDYSSATFRNQNNIIDLKDAVDMAIDTNIYVLKKDGSIVRIFDRTKLEILPMTSNISDPLENLNADNVSMKTNARLKNIYIMDKLNQRILVYGKRTPNDTRELVYNKQYSFPTLELRDFYVDDNEDRMYILTKDKIYIQELN